VGSTTKSSNIDRPTRAERLWDEIWQWSDEEFARRLAGTRSRSPRENVEAQERDIDEWAERAAARLQIT
jgi:hypothetical protein